MNESLAEFFRAMMAYRGVPNSEIERILQEDREWWAQANDNLLAQGYSSQEIEDMTLNQIFALNGVKWED
jgi:hypothetical protein